MSSTDRSTAGDTVTATLRLWDLGGLTWWSLLSRARKAFREHDFDARSAQFAYFSLLTAFPLLILLIAALAHLPVAGVIENSLDAAERGLPRNVAQLLARQVADIKEHSTLGLIGLSSLVVAFAGSRIFMTISGGLNMAYGVRETRRSWQVYGLAVLLTVAASILVLVALVLMIAGPMLSSWVAAHQLDIGWLRVLLQRGVRWVVVCAALWIYTSTIYWVGPCLRLPWYWLSPGSVVATAGWVIVTQGFRLYVENLGSYNQTYGALGGVIVLVVWLDLTGAMLFFGGEVNAVIYRAENDRRPKRSTPGGSQ